MKRKPKQYLTASEKYALAAIYGDNFAQMTTVALTYALAQLHKTPTQKKRESDALFEFYACHPAD